MSPSWIRKCARWQITVFNPMDAPGKLAVRLDKLFDRLPRLLNGYKETNRQKVAMKRAHKIVQAAQVALGVECVLVAATPFGPDQQHAKIRIAPHPQVNVDATSLDLQVLSSVSAFCPQSSGV